VQDQEVFNQPNQMQGVAENEPFIPPPIRELFGDLIVDMPLIDQVDDLGRMMLGTDMLNILELAAQQLE
jgi:hypothetical protein